jgi:hypothetical protein
MTKAILQRPVNSAIKFSKPIQTTLVSDSVFYIRDCIFQSTHSQRAEKEDGGLRIDQKGAFQESG